MSDVEFVDGLIVKKPHQNAPDFIKCKLSIRREELLEWLQKKQSEWINIDIKESQKGSWYAQVNDWQPNGVGQGVQTEQSTLQNNSQDNSGAPLPEEPPVIDDDDFDIGKVPF